MRVRCSVVRLVELLVDVEVVLLVEAPDLACVSVLTCTITVLTGSVAILPHAIAILAGAVAVLTHAIAILVTARLSSPDRQFPNRDVGPSFALDPLEEESDWLD